MVQLSEIADATADAQALLEKHGASVLKKAIRAVESVDLIDMNVLRSLGVGTGSRVRLMDATGAADLANRRTNYVALLMSASKRVPSSRHIWKEPSIVPTAVARVVPEAYSKNDSLSPSSDPSSLGV